MFIHPIVLNFFSLYDCTESCTCRLSSAGARGLLSSSAQASHCSGFPGKHRPQSVQITVVNPGARDLQLTRPRAQVVVVAHGFTAQAMWDQTMAPALIRDDS